MQNTRQQQATKITGPPWCRCFYCSFFAQGRQPSYYSPLYEAGKISHPIKMPPRDNRWLSIGRKLKFTDLIGLANVDGMGWDRIGSDGIGWDRIGWDRTPF